MLSLEEAQEKILSLISPGAVSTVPVDSALGGWLSEDVFSQADLPSFDNSAMDGYAVRSEDLGDVRVDRRIRLKCAQTIPAGAYPTFNLKPGECARIFTGSVLPRGADAVVMQEDVELQGEWVEFQESVKPLENLRLRGEDLKRGETLANRGERLTPGLIAVMSASGVHHVRIGSRAKVVVLATGTELVEPGGELPPGGIYESNRAMLSAFLRESGATAEVAPLVPDTLQGTSEALERAFQTADVVISSGGVSVGDYDFVKEAFERIGGKWNFWRVALKPGKPFVFGTVGHKLFFALPGNPISAAVTFLLLVRPAVLKLQHAANVHLPALDGVMAERTQNRGDRPHFIRGIMSPDRVIRTSGPQASHLFRSFARANVLVRIPADAVLEQGTSVKALLFGAIGN